LEAYTKFHRQAVNDDIAFYNPADYIIMSAILTLKCAIACCTVLYRYVHRTLYTCTVCRYSCTGNVHCTALTHFTAL